MLLLLSLLLGLSPIPPLTNGRDKSQQSVPADLAGFLFSFHLACAGSGGGASSLAE